LLQDFGSALHLSKIRSAAARSDDDRETAQRLLLRSESDFANREAAEGETMSAQIFVPMLFGIVLAVYAGIVLQTWYRTRGRRVVKCPARGTLAAVELDTRHAIATALFEGAELRIRNCSRWPQHENCDQGCAAAAAAAPRIGSA
jgi:hypothetical protein